MKNQKIIGFIIIGLVIAGLGFWGGMKYGSSKSSSSQFANRQGSFSQNSGRNAEGMMRVFGGGLVSGEILSKDDKSVTVKLRDGGSKIVFVSGTTKVEKTVDGLLSDVIVGNQVSIIGTANPDGSVNATSVQLRPIITKDVPTRQ